MMKDRIAKILQIKKMNATRFAEELDIQRSGISHILSGRNKPSLDLIVKIKETYPEFSLEWLIFGKGPITEVQIDFDKAKQKNQNPELFELAEYATKPLQENVAEVKSAILNPKEEDPIEYGIKKNLQEISGRLENEVLLEKIVFFYKDGTFKVYKQVPI